MKAGGYREEEYKEEMDITGAEVSFCRGLRGSSPPAPVPPCSFNKYLFCTLAAWHSVGMRGAGNTDVNKRQHLPSGVYILAGEDGQ